jgi:polyisoprenoid-binding protein YceI
MTATTTDFRALTGTYTLDVAHSRIGFAKLVLELFG